MMGQAIIRIVDPVGDKILVLAPGEHLVRFSHVEVTEEAETVLVYQYVGAKKEGSR